ncbi:MAG: DUF1442 domain-containing protein [Sphaerobacter sp.]|nr:DUF1442 domain-containing protein [Sphaerobacter sp.]
METPRYPEHAIADPRARAVLDRLRAADQAQRAAGLPVAQRTRNITAATGRFLYAIARATGARRIFEMGSSNGYSTIWLALAARETGGRVTGSEVLAERATEAARNLAEAGLAQVAEVRVGDAAALATDLSEPLDLVFIDAEKDDYARLFLAVVDHVRSGGLILTDNVVSHDCAAFQALVRSRDDVLTLTVPLERGIEFTVKR